MLEVIENCCSKTLLKAIYEVAIQEDNWHIRYPATSSIDDRFFKMDICRSYRPQKDFLFGLSVALLIEIYDSLEVKSFDPRKISYCGISLKDNSLEDKKHIDHPRDTNTIKIFGMLNEDWNHELDGGGFIHGDKIVPLSYGTFCIFDPRVEHCAEKIKTNKKRISIDYGVEKI